MAEVWAIKIVRVSGEGLLGMGGRDTPAVMAEGWEPFAAVGDVGRFAIILRRRAQ